MRTFIAIELPEEIKKQIEKLQAPLKRTRAYVSWVKPGNIHVTLKFLGEVPEEKIDDVFSATERAVEGIGSFGMSLKGTGGFPNLRRPRVIWIGTGSGAEELSRLAERMEQEMEKIGFPKENRKFSPHFTIGRVKSPRNIEELAGKVESAEFQTEEIRVTEVVVMRSQLNPAGAIYTPLKKVPLG
jgi:2'-5' RNA ligase